MSRQRLASAHCSRDHPARRLIIAFGRPPFESLAGSRLDKNRWPASVPTRWLDFRSIGVDWKRRGCARSVLVRELALAELVSGPESSSALILTQDQRQQPRHLPRSGLLPRALSPWLAQLPKVGPDSASCLLLFCSSARLLLCNEFSIISSNNF